MKDVTKYSLPKSRQRALNWAKKANDVSTRSLDDEKHKERETRILKANLLAAMARDTPTMASVFREENGGRNPHDIDTNIYDDDVGRYPDWADPWFLVTLPIEELGAPEGSIEWDTMELGQSPKTKAYSPSLEPIQFNYAKSGWAMEWGPSLRWVTPWEHREILRRLKGSELTKPGSVVPLTSVSLGSVLASDLEPPPYLIDGLLRTGGAAMVYGPTGVGKSWLTLSLALALAAGGTAAFTDDDGNQLIAGTGRGVRVAWLDGEMVLPDIKARAKALLTGLKGTQATEVDFPDGKGMESGDVTPVGSPEVFGDGCDLSIEATAERIVVWAKSQQEIGAAFPDLSDREWHPRIISYAKANDVKAFVFDNLSTLCPALEDENSATAWAPLNDLVVALKKEGIAVILVHHAGKNGSYRGSSNIITALETVLKLEAPRREAGGGRDAAFKVSLEKQRAHGAPAISGKTLRLSDGRWHSEVDEIGEMKRVRELVLSGRFVNQRELADAMVWSQPTVSRTLSMMEAGGILNRCDRAQAFKRAREIRAARNVIELPGLNDDEAVLDI